MFADKIARMKANNWTGCVMTIKELEEIQETIDALLSRIETLIIHMESYQRIAKRVRLALLDNDRKLACEYLQRIAGDE